jgi:tRNA (guanine26-N2/guanine27-N2)-dimethyltransferase
MALRILLASIESHANRYKRYIVPVLSLSVDFYVRVFVRIYTSASTIKETPSKLCYVYQCVGCDSFHLQPVGRIASRQGSVRYLPGTGPVISPDCKQCGKHHNMGGPMWSAPIHNSEWIASMLSSVSSMKTRYPAFGKVHSILTAVSEVGFIRMQISGDSFVHQRRDVNKLFPCCSPLGHSRLNDNQLQA